MKRAILLGLLALFAPVIPAHAALYVVAPRIVDDRKAVFGTVESVHQTEARARIAGTLVSVSVVEGDQVKAGQQIALIEDPKLPLQLAQSDAQLKSLAAQRDEDQLAFSRMQVLRRTGTVSQAQYDQARTALEVVIGQIAAMQASRQLILEQQAEGAVLAPVAGRILKVDKIAGTVTMPGEAVATLAEQHYVLRIYLPERHARFIKPGDPVAVGAAGLGSTAAEMREGHIRLVYPELDNGRVVADIAVAGLGNFFVGERTLVTVSTGPRHTYIVPPQFVSRRFGVYFVRIKHLGEIPIQVGAETAQGIEVLSGIHTGDILVGP